MILSSARPLLHSLARSLALDTDKQVVYNKNSAMSWNTLEIAGELGINRVVIASSVNSIGMSESHSPFIR